MVTKMYMWKPERSWSLLRASALRKEDGQVLFEIPCPRKGPEGTLNDGLDSRTQSRALGLLGRHKEWQKGDG
jgi:hypothetical protein